MERGGVHLPRVGTARPGGRRSAAALALVFLAQSLLPLLALVAVAPGAGASLITTDEAGRSSFEVPVTGVPQTFNVSVPDGAVVTSFKVGVGTAPGQSPPNAPASVALDLGGLGTAWSVGAGPEGHVGWQTQLADGSTTGTCAVGNGDCSFSFLIPNDARVESFTFDVEPSPNMTLCDTPDFVSVVVGVAAVPLNLSASSTITLADLDRDGVLDLVGTGSAGAIRVFSRVGSSGMLFNETAGAVNASLANGRVFMHPQVADMNGDGAPDIVVGTGTGDLVLLVRRNATVGPPFEFEEDPSFFSGVHVTGNAMPALGDLDGDGDLDLVVGSSAGELFHYRNDVGNTSGVSWQVVGTFLSANISVPSSAAPSLADLDGDGDLDLTVGTGSGRIVQIENRGDRTAPRFESNGALGCAFANSRAAPANADVDGDGVPDLVYGSGGGLVYFSRSLGGLPANVTATVDGVLQPVAVSSGPMSAGARVELSASDRADFSAATLPITIDTWGNPFEESTISFSSTHFGDIALRNLSIAYDATFTVPDLASRYRQFAANATPQGNLIVVPMTVAGTPAVGAVNASVAVRSIAVVVDDRPVFLEPPFLAIDEDTANPYLLDLRTIVNDENPTALVYEVASYTNESFARVEITDGAYLGVDVATGPLNDNWTGTVEIVVRATDGLGQAALSPPLPVVVRQVEDAPVIESITTQYLEPDESLRLTVVAIDGDPGDTIQFSLIDPTPATATIDAETGFLYWNPTSADRAAGVEHFYIYAFDGTLGDVELFQVRMIPSLEPVFGQPLPGISVLPGRPEFMDIFDFATGDLSEVLSVFLEPHPYVNLSADGQWLAFDYPADYAPGSDRVTAHIETVHGVETAAVEVEVMARPAGLYIAPFPPSPIGRGVTHRVELLRYVNQVVDFRNLTFSVDNPLASVSGYNLTLLAPPEYPGQSLTVTVTARAGDETASARWRVNLMAPGELPRLTRMPLVAGAVRTVDLTWALSQRAVGPDEWPLSTDSLNFTVAGANVFSSTFAEWPLAVSARDFWPVERVRIFAADGKPLLEVETAYDGRSRYIDRLQYFGEDESAPVDATFVTEPSLAGGQVHIQQVIGTGPFTAGPLEPMQRLGGGEGVGWHVKFTRDTHLEQFSIVGLAEGGGSDSTVSWTVWAVVTPRDDPPVYIGGAGNLVVDPGLSLTADLAAHFEDEEGDDLLFSLSQAHEGVALDRSTGQLRVDGVETLNLSGVWVIASEARNQSLFAQSDPFNIHLNVTAEPAPTERPSTPLDMLSDPIVAVILLVIGIAASAGLTVYFWTRRRPEGGQDDGEEAWEAVLAERPPPTEPPVPDDPAMLALEEEWSRVIASRHTDGATPAEETEADLAAGVKSRARPPAGPPEPEPRSRPAMSSSDTETERRAGDTETEAPWSRRRMRRR